MLDNKGEGGHNPAPNYYKGVINMDDIEIVTNDYSVEAIPTTEEIAERLYELCQDMDSEDYSDTREEDIAQLEQAIYKLKLYAKSNEDFEVLYKALELL